MATRSPAEVKLELASERKGLEHAATTLRTESGKFAIKVGIAAAAVVAAAITAKVVARVSHGEKKGKEKRARLSFPGKD
ncbi:MAG TPA: hypothetical protein VLK53_01705 [Gaiellaceae bacterium]|jgi:hypothetical protein|nr:hypothetical protein [Gaiellaceae bacterium]